MDDLPLVWPHHPQDSAGQGGFASAGFAHQAQNLAVADVERHVVEDLLVGSPAEQSAVVVAAGNVAEGKDQFLAHDVPSFRCRVGMAAISRWV